ncbi:MAG: phenylpropionate dioxygenase-like ring-hydroxylating dioxygenase large terminal subunit [Gammaproteobacteria bacterium]|jgi:phenylpropionate dioxygenase-like ring-hydroxylating dioxygenase large terminal subunit
MKNPESLTQHPSRDKNLPDYDEMIQEDRVHRLLYTDPAIFDEEMTKIFGGIWVYLAHESQVSENDDYVTSYLGLRPIIITRDSEGKLHALFNRCTHRGTTVCRLGKGTTKTFQCPYHGWTFLNSGKLSGVPWPEGYSCDFSNDKFNLAQLPQVESYRGFIFGTLNENPPTLLDFLGPIKKPIDEWLDRLPGGKLVLSESNRMKYKGNWKLAYDNSADGYHVLFSHRSLLAMENRMENSEKKGMSFYKNSPDLAAMYVKYMGNGHHFKDKRPNIDNYPGALWENEANHPGMEHYEDKLRAKLGDKAGHALDLAASMPVNINVFPNLLILGNHIQVLQPLSVNETNSTWYATAIVHANGEFDEVVEDINALRMRTQESFPNFGEVDDMTNFEQIQIGLAALEDEWVYMNRGLGIPDRIKLEEDGTIVAPATDEMFMREYMQEYKRIMKRETRLVVTRDIG